MRRAFLLAITLVLIAGVGAHPLRAQSSTTRGFNLGIHGTAGSLVIEDGDRMDAGGLGLIAGYGVNRTVEIFLQIDGMKLDVEDSPVQGDWNLGHADLGVRFHFANSLRRWIPYLQAALSARAAGVDNPTVNGTPVNGNGVMVGGGLTLGGGVVFYFTQSLGGDLQFTWTTGTFTSLEVGNITFNDLDLDAKSNRLSLGLSWWP